MTDALWEPHLPYVFASLEGIENAVFSAGIHARSSCTSHVDVQGLDNSLVRLGCAQVYGTVRTNPRRNVRTDPDLFYPPPPQRPQGMCTGQERGTKVPG